MVDEFRRYLIFEYLCNNLNNMIDVYDTLLFMVDKFEVQLSKSMNVVIDDELRDVVSSYMKSSMVLYDVYMSMVNMYNAMCRERLEKLREKLGTGGW